METKTKKSLTLRQKIEAVMNDHDIVPDDAYSLCCDLLAHSDEAWMLKFISAIAESQLIKA